MILLKLTRNFSRCFPRSSFKCSFKHFLKMSFRQEFSLQFLAGLHLEILTGNPPETSARGYCRILQKFWRECIQGYIQNNFPEFFQKLLEFHQILWELLHIFSRDSINNFSRDFLRLFFKKNIHELFLGISSDFFWKFRKIFSRSSFRDFSKNSTKQSSNDCFINLFQNLHRPCFSNSLGNCIRDTFGIKRFSCFQLCLQ